ncbi:hypothetical protein NPX13_g4754 [Xylaria arbuscula]|uniref:Heterokaryon incompatibility domain-containing protein n=1 Tax=Xylaria arbuscula TaxID=114810 RepID=A0A9W8TN08_9PEZI|nr:hypothetical protein NPX13_g4754 [Xylaria arbuscula]
MHEKSPAEQRTREHRDKIIYPFSQFIPVIANIDPTTQMRLLKVQRSGNASLTEDLQHDIPAYAILSHTWGSDNQEVRFSDIRGQIARTKTGYKKIDFCQKQADKDGLQYFWVDTCCINQDSEVELTRSINSMFRWYRDAKKCYVYLSDVSMKCNGNSLAWEESFLQSRWFTRGWTLQELIAPRVVEFFSSEGQFLGDKTSLEQRLCTITGIPAAALRGNTLSQFSINERMSWSQNRETKLAEDKAYCLLGIFDIHMPLIYGEGGKHACRRLRKELEGYQKQQPEPFSTVPFTRDPNFVDRPEILAWINEKCNGPATRLALTGIGGVGKSQAVIEYAYRMRDNRPQTWVFWVHASTAARVEEAYRGIADRLDLPGRHDPNANVCQLVSNWLCDERNGRWVLILDNADNIETFFPQQKPHDTSSPLGNYLPQSPNGSIVVTSRNKDAAVRIVGDLRNVMQVRAMGKSQALQLFRNRLHTASNEDEMAELLDALDYIPLAITQAAAYINRRPRMTVLSYLDEFRGSAQQKRKLLHRDSGDLRRDGSASNSVKTTWRVSFESMRKERPSAADVLSLMGFFYPQGIPEWMLRKYYKTLSNNEEDTDGEFDDDMDLLQALSFVTTAVDEYIYQIHALVQFCTRDWLCSRCEEEVWRRRFLNLMATEFPTGEFQNRTKCQQLLPHLETLFEQELPGDEAAKEWAQLLTNVAWYLWREGQYNTAQDAAVKAFKIKERIFRFYDTSTLTTATVLASVLRGQGKYNEAEEMNRRTAEGYEKVLGKQHPHTLTSVNNLALVLRDQGKYKEAGIIQRRALEGRKKELGVQHPDTLASMSNLALVLRDEGKYDEAETLNRQALEGREKLLGKRHPHTLTTASNLALVLYEQGKYGESETTNRQVLEGREAELGQQHPYTQMSRSNLALVLQGQGKYGEAEIMNRRVLGANLASVLQDQGKYNEAEQLNRQVLEERERVLGEQHPDTLTSLSSLAFTLRCEEKFEEAETLNRQALEGREKILGSHHPDTLTSVNNLSLVLLDQQKYAEAERLSRHAVQGYRTELGAQHPHTLTSLNNLASILQHQKKYEEAETTNRQVLGAYKKELGMEHPDTLRSVSNLASILQGQGRFEESEKLNRRALEGREKQLGMQHPDTIKSACDLASVLQDQGKYDEAAKLKRYG